MQLTDAQGFQANGEGSKDDEEDIERVEDKPEQPEGVEEGATGGDLLEIGVNDEVAKDDNDDEEEEHEDNEYEDEYNAEEKAYLKQFITKESGKQVGQAGQILFWSYLFSHMLCKKDRQQRMSAGKQNYTKLADQDEEEEQSR